ncbi:hypothetical protein FHR93_002280 [Geodermatophilus sabuli]|uniref:Transposase, Mutator family n=1 Tax=Geodermatophilus sabuli TaxID=1564158 RepID=A0A285ECD6_9ACTN|nr:hypothetical protein [Geodermatophilus sabuli]SNX96660.1 hypothetical protein SAMN06893097_104375 [Geodermatophilus sabuli]
MALDQSALLELLEALRAADVDDRIRTATETLCQALIEARLTAVIGAGPPSGALRGWCRSVRNQEAPAGRRF